MRKVAIIDYKTWKEFPEGDSDTVYMKSGNTGIGDKYNQLNLYHTIMVAQRMRPDVIEIRCREIGE